MGGDGGDKETSGCQMDREEIGLEFSQWLCGPISGEEVLFASSHPSVAVDIQYSPFCQDARSFA